MKSFILHIETSTKTCSVALSKDGKLVDCIESTPENYTHAEVLAIYIDDLFKRNAISAKELKAVAVSKGPGSFTGLRIGISTAKGLCYALSIPLIAIDSLHILANHFIQSNSITDADMQLKPMIDARRKEVYTALFNVHKELVSPIDNEIITETPQLTKNQIWFGDGADKFFDVINSPFIEIIKGISTSAKGMVEIAENRFIHQNFEDSAYFEPFYLKDFVTGKKT